MYNLHPNWCVWLGSLSGAMHPHCWGFETTLRHIAFGRAPLDEWLDRCRHLYLTTHSTQKKNTVIQALGGIRTRNPSKWVAADARLRLRHHTQTSRSSTTFFRSSSVIQDNNSWVSWSILMCSCWRNSQYRVFFQYKSCVIMINITYYYYYYYYYY